MIMKPIANGANLLMPLLSTTVAKIMNTSKPVRVPSMIKVLGIDQAGL